MTSGQIMHLITKGVNRFDDMHQKIYLEEIINLLSYDMRIIASEDTNDLFERLRYYELKEAIEGIEYMLSKHSIRKKKIDGQDDSGKDKTDEGR